MKWPLPQDFNEAIQNPAISFADPDLAGGKTVTGPHGLPLPHSGNFADVYQIHGADGQNWAVKCFTRPVFGLNVRYARLAEELSEAGFRFTVDFNFLAEGIRVRGEWRPIIKMEWVEGRPLNLVVGDSADNAKVLRALAHRWMKLTRQLREAGMAHGDIQHGNVLLVPGSRPGAYALKLVDYDGMYVPSLASTPSGEAGHPNFQHPERVVARTYSPDLDRFPHLVVITALKVLEHLGPDLWSRYDNGDNLLFTERDFRDPARSAVMRELWQSGHPAVQSLVGRLALACGRPLSATPWVYEIAPDGGDPMPLDDGEDAEASALLGSAGAFLPVIPKFDVEEQESAQEVGWEPAEEDYEEPEPGSYEEIDYEERRDVDASPSSSRRSSRHRRRSRPSPPPRGRTKRNSLLPVVIGFGTLAVTAAVVIGVALTLSGKPPDSETARATRPENPTPELPEVPFEATPRLPPAGPTPTPDFTEVPPSTSEAVTVYSLPRLRLLWDRLPGGPKISRLTFTADGKYLVASAYNRSKIAVFNPDTGAAVGQPFTQHDSTVLGVAPLPGGQILSVAGDRDHALIWDPETQKLSGRAFCPPVPGRQPEPFVYASPNGRFFMCGGTESDNWKATSFTLPIYVTDIETGKPVVSFPMRWGVARFTADSSRLVVAHDKTGLIQVIHLPTAKLESEVKAEGETGMPLAIAVSPDGKYAVFLVSHEKLGQGKFNVYEVATGRYVKTIPVPHTCGLRGGFSPNGKWLAILHNDPDYGRIAYQVVLVDAATWTPVAYAFVPGSNAIQWDHGMRFSPDGTRLVVPTYSGVMMAFEVPTDVSGMARNSPLGQINAAWKHVDLGPSQLVGRIVRMRVNDHITLRDPPAGPFEIVVGVRAGNSTLHVLGSSSAQIIFNMGPDPKRFRFYRTAPAGTKPDFADLFTAPLTPGRWYTIRWRMTSTQSSVWVDDRLMFDEQGSYDLSGEPSFKIASISELVEVSTFRARSLK